jgi:hypothetical protein
MTTALCFPIYYSQISLPFDATYAYELEIAPLNKPRMNQT